MMIPFEYLEHTADVKFRAYGTTPDQMLSNAAEAEDLEDLAYQWLSEIVFLFETESAVFSRFQVALEEFQDGKGWKLRAEIGGERMDPERHSFLAEVKAVTRHKFAIEKNERWCIQVVLDV